MKKNGFLSDIILGVVVIAVLVGLRAFVFTPVEVVGDSMDPTLQDGERVIALKNTDLKRFDIVTFPAPDAAGKNYIKRIIGLPGDTVEYKDDVLYVNGKAMKETYLDEYKEALDDGQPLTPDFTLETYFDSATVPDGYLFVMGDNRRISKDSRIIGYIAEKNVTGDVRFCFWPFDRFGTVE